MSKAEYGLVTIGNALVDVLATTTEDYIERQDRDHGMKKGSMNLVDDKRALDLYSDMQSPTKMSGGSAGNTMACFASFGGKGGYIGKVAEDELGKAFSASLKDMGVYYNTKPLSGGVGTGRCMILVTPDGERTMNTYLGAAVELTPADIEEELIKNAQVTYLEGYLYDPPQAMEAFIKAARIAHEAGRMVSLTLSDPFCVGRHREAFKDLVQNHVDILFANEHELQSLYETDTLEEALEIVKNKCAISATTMSEKGSIIINSGHRYNIEAEKGVKVVDSTGAGDAYAAGFLYGFTEGMDMDACGRLGSIAAAEVIAQMGPRPSVNLADLAKQKKAA
ncbi:MAG TPA: adenosine kinase [Alphaproteobacteria bacterium]|nr:adenosine kinase [Alphaproteobacteria bacterium]